MNDISVFDHPKPNLGENTVCELLLRDYGIVGTLKPLVSERDQNFLVTTTDAQYVLKIANVAEERHFLELQNATLKHCARVDPVLGVPKLIPAKNKSDLVDWTSSDGVHAVRLLTYLPGKLFSSVKKSPQLLASLGAFMGRLSRAMQGFGHPVAHRPDFLWNLDNTLAVKPWIADITTPERRALVERIFARYELRAAPRLHALRAAVLHQDCNDNNIVVDNSASPR
jgi:Ser/Thr protein kinase RdoA (MazF antagonist)